MKTERRHELETNELSIRLGKITEAIQPRARAMVAGVVVVVAIVLIVQYSRSTSATRSQLGWDQYATALSNQDPFELESLGEEYKDAPVGNWARLMLADQYLASGVRESFRDRARSNAELNKAITNYEAVRAGAKDDLLMQRAHFGLGRTHEALSKLDDAQKNYQAVVDTWSESALALAAQNRLDDISRKRTQLFYDWFAKQTPQAEFLSDEPGTPGTRPDFDLEGLDLDALLAPDGDVELDLNAPITDDTTVPDGESNESEPSDVSADSTDEAAADSESSGDTQSPADTASESSE